MIVGIDPGKTGGVAALLDDGRVEAILVMPPPAELARFLDRIQPDHVWIEKVHAMPKQGVSSCFSFGVTFGETLGVLGALKLSHTLITPQRWQKEIHQGTAGGDPKARSLEAARRLFPEVDFRATARCRKPHDGMIDAILIAEYGRRHDSGAKARREPGSGLRAIP